MCQTRQGRPASHCWLRWAEMAATAKPEWPLSSRASPRLQSEQPSRARRSVVPPLFVGWWPRPAHPHPLIRGIHLAWMLLAASLYTRALLAAACQGWRGTRAVRGCPYARGCIACWWQVKKAKLLDWIDELRARRGSQKLHIHNPDKVSRDSPAPAASRLCDHVAWLCLPRCSAASGARLCRLILGYIRSPSRAQPRVHAVCVLQVAHHSAVRLALLAASVH